MTGTEYYELYKQSPDRAYDALFDAYCDYVYAIVYNKIRGVAAREDVEECVGDIFADVVFGFNAEGDLSADIKGYVGTVAKRRAINAFHSLAARRNRFSEDSEEAMSVIESGSDIEADSDTAETRRILIKKINELGEPDSIIILQKYYYDRTSGEIAELLHMKASAVRMRASRALDKLKASLTAAGIAL